MVNSACILLLMRIKSEKALLRVKPVATNMLPLTGLFHTFQLLIRIDYQIDTQVYFLF
jgi:hypothetical protein